MKGLYSEVPGWKTTSRKWTFRRCWRILCCLLCHSLLYDMTDYVITASRVLVKNCLPSMECGTVPWPPLTVGCSSWVVTRLKDTLRVSSNMIDPMAYSGEEEECFSFTVMWELATHCLKARKTPSWGTTQTASWTSASRSIRNKFVTHKLSCLVLGFSSLCRLVYDTCPIYLKYKIAPIEEC